MVTVKTSFQLSNSCLWYDQHLINV